MAISSSVQNNSESKLKEVKAALFKKIPEDVLLSLFVDTYRVAGDRYDPEEGFDLFSFGVDLYQIPRKKLGDYAVNHGINYKKKGLDLRLILPGNIQFAVRRVKGKNSSVDDISVSFPSNYKCMFPIDIESNQLCLPFEELDTMQSKPQPTNYLLAHNGSVDKGLNGIYVCEIGDVVNGKITSWKAYDTVYEVEAENTENRVPQYVDTSDSKIEQFAPEKINLPPLKKKA